VCQRRSTKPPRPDDLRANVASALRDTIRLKPVTHEAQQQALLNEARTWADEGLQLDAENELTQRDQLEVRRQNPVA
jgi:hypothetical protein